MDWVLLLSRLCIGVTIASNGGGIPVFVDIVRKGTTHSVPFLPFLAGFVSNTACLAYAMLRADSVLQIVSSVGMTMSTIYVTLFLFFSSKKSTTFRQLMLSGVGILSVYVYLTRIIREPSAVEIQLGLLIGFLITGMNMAPIADIGNILKKQSSDGLSLSMALAIFVTSVLWVLYGIAVDDLVLSLPSISGVLSGSVQFYLLWSYPAKGKAVKSE
ncbi:sugar transporter SWEET1-like [Patiria miniata]|uniref:Sugar transporter SWEET1 n=1 Tax=Patiria miniata TaxID=46514 RepID=A0A914B8Y1_PATMI|nr:sugar transporter SWEET1-like [Patiria miniata]